MPEEKFVDLRSDTVTRPSPGMRKVISEAVVGDDVLGDDPTVKQLEEIAAKLLGKEAAVYVPSGTMSNQIALFTVSQRGDEILCETGCHIVNYEAGAPAALSSLLVNLLPGDKGVLSAETIEANIRPINIHYPITKIVALENTNNRAGGTIYPIDTIAEIAEVAQKNKLWLHLDGARLWNAHIATGVPLDKYGSYFDSISVCLSKGLGAPIGSILLGSAEFIEKARRSRKIFGGGMRQVGILAAAGIYALENNIGRLAYDHMNAKYLGDQFSKINGLSVDLETVQTNIVIVDIENEKMTADEFIDQLASHNVRCIKFSPQRVRFVTHLDVSEDDCKMAVEAVKRVMKV
ncbi:MAG: low-specificity L-threonine aldolase [candidate division Zixibacteria bacterium]|nr:low-specificity L-threonine aldolase [candidate division Zixibacteria bacterium]